MKKALIVLLFIISPAALPAQEAMLTLHQYLAGAEAAQPGLAGALSAEEGEKLLRDEGEAMLSPRFFAETSLSQDNSGQLLPGLQGDYAKAASVSAGASLKTRGGFEGRAYYSFGRDVFHGSALGNIDQWKASQNIELSAALWRNRRGRETAAAIDSARALRDAQAEEARAEASVLRARAEQAYWRLAAIKESLEISSGSLRSAREMLAWSRAMSQAGLADPSEALGAAAAAKLREQELLEKTGLLRQAARRFNFFLGRNSDETPADLEKVDSPSFKPEAGVRRDVLAAELRARAAVLAAAASAESVKPTLDVAAKLSLNGFGAEAGGASRGAFSAGGAAASAGLRLNMPFSGALARDNRRGYERLAGAARLKYRQALLDSEAELAAQSELFDTLQGQLSLAREVEAAQEEKYRVERARREKGKTTVYFMLAYQDDYAAARQRSVAVALDLRLLRAELGLFAR